MSDQPQPPPGESSAGHGGSHPYGSSSSSPPSGYGQGSQPMFGGPPPAYPQQDLLPQEVQPGRSRKPLIVALLVVLVLIGAGIGAWLLLLDNGESTRAAYCTALKKLVPDNDLVGVVANTDTATTLAQVKNVSDLAPGGVAKDWRTLDQLMTSATAGSTPDPASLLTALGALRGIVQDANGHCGMSLTIPGLGG